MYIAKRDGKGGYRLFEPAMHEGVLARLELRADLQRAIDSGDQLELHYQPVVRLGDGRVSGVEALLRWRHPERGLVRPDQFIPFAEEMGLIVPIGRWVLREGCRQAVLMQEALPTDPPMTMSVNLSVKQLQHSDIVADVRDALAESGLEPSRLTLEITETVMMTDTALAVQRLSELKELGVRLAMDDFGTGYSSLSYLSKFPVDILKMDRSFLREDGGRVARRYARPRGRRRGHRAVRAVDDAARPRVRPGPGLLLRAPDAVRRHAGLRPLDPGLAAGRCTIATRHSTAPVASAASAC
jgi:EAL domain-containing protein (putative c-di-GMP-specific phosphodiesterase class I)